MSENARPAGGTRTTFGTQPSSRKLSAPAYGFGSGTREQQAKVFVSHEHSALAGSSASPGPVYESRGTIGPQPVGLSESAPEWKFGSDQRWERGNRSTLDNPAPGKYDAASGIGNQSDSKKVSLPHFGFGTSTREDQERVFVTQEHNKTLFGRLSPGPSTYTLNPAMGKQHLSYEPVGFQRKIRNGSQPSWIFGKSERLGAAQPNSVPGPGAYKTVSAVAPQANSTKPSKPSYGFGTSNRDHAAKVFISKEHNAVTGGRDAPGPGQYAMKSLTGTRLASSRAVSGPSYGFGAKFVDAFSKDKTNSPGPGAYVI